MGLKEILESIRERNMEKKKKFKELKEDFEMQKKLEEMQKSSNERELERFLKEKREERIKKELEVFRKRRQNEVWHGHQILTPGTSILKDDNPILKQKKIFSLNKGNMFIK